MRAIEKQPGVSPGSQSPEPAEGVRRRDACKNDTSPCFEQSAMQAFPHGIGAERQKPYPA